MSRILITSLKYEFSEQNAVVNLYFFNSLEIIMLVTFMYFVQKFKFSVEKLYEYT